MSAPSARRVDAAGTITLFVYRLQGGTVASLDEAGRRFDAPDWDAFVTRQPGATAFHETAWLRTVTSRLRHTGFALEARDPGGALLGVLPLVHVRSRLFGRYMLSVPFASYGGPLGTAEAAAVLCAAAARITQAEHAHLLELRCRHPLATTPEHYSVSHRKITVTLSLEGGAEATHARFPSKLRSQIRRSEKDGVTVTVAPGQALPFFEVYSRHMRDLGTPALPRALFEELADAFGERMLFAVARLDGAPIAVGAGFMYGSEFEITWAAALRSHQRLAPNMAMYWRLIEHVAKAGATTFNFGRCSVDSGTHRFKRQWGGVDEPLHWYQWAPDGPPGDTPAPGGRFSLAQAVWSRLPVPVTRLLGPWLARSLP